MNASTFQDIEKLGTNLWEAADNLRANSKLTSSDYFMPLLGVIFLRHAANRFPRQLAIRWVADTWLRISAAPLALGLTSFGSSTGQTLFSRIFCASAVG
jgi:hypothetical protein